MRNRRVLFGGLLALAALGGVFAHFVSRARAAGIPTMQPMVYSGTLTDMNGVALTGAKNIQIELWDQATDGTQRCSVGPTSEVLTAGAFQMALPATCTTAVHATGDLWVEVFVDGNSLGRTKLGATPYAVEADHAVSADQSSAGFMVPGDLNVSGGLNVVGNSQLTGNVSVGGILIRKIARAHGLGPDDPTDNGVIASRVLTFTKTQAATGVRIAYTDDLRVANQGACQWEIKFNGVSCATPGPLIYDLYYGGVANMNHHRAGSVFGTCFGLAAGNYTVQVSVGLVSSGAAQPQGDCDTGWYAQYWAIEAEEVL